MAKLTLTNINSGYQTVAAINSNNDLIEAAIENTLSRDGSTPNTMGANFDMNNHSIINLSPPTTASSAARLIDVQSNSLDASATAQLRIDLGDSSGSTLVGFIQNGAGATSRTVQGRLRDSLNITDFYANGVSGVAVDPLGVVDSTLGIQAAIDAASTSGYRTVYIPSGIYKVSAPLVVSISNIAIIGESRSTSIINRSTDYGNTFTIYSGTAGVAVDRFTMKDLYIDADHNMTTGAHIHATGLNYANFQNIETNKGWDNWYFAACTQINMDGIYSFNNGQPTTGHLNKTLINFTSNVTFAHPSCGDVFISNFNMRGSSVAPYFDYCVRIQSADGIWFSNGHFQGAGEANILFDSMAVDDIGLVFMDNVMSDKCWGSGIRFKGGATEGRNFKFNNMAIKGGGTGTYGIEVIAGASYSELSFSNITISQFLNDGVNIASSAFVSSEWIGLRLRGNSYGVLNNGSGLVIGPLCGYANFIGGCFGYDSIGVGVGLTKYGADISGTATKVTLNSVDLNGNSTASADNCISTSVRFLSCFIPEADRNLTLNDISPIYPSGAVDSMRITNGIVSELKNLLTTIPGKTLVLEFLGVTTVVQTGNIRLDAAYVSTANSTLTLMFNGINWLETGRSIV